MSIEETPNRRDFMKAAAAAGITGIAGCSGGAEDGTDNSSTSDQPPNGSKKGDTGDEPSNQDIDYTPRIQRGKEFEWFVDPRHYFENNVITDGAFGSENGREIFDTVPWQVYRTPDIVESLDDGRVEDVNEFAPIIVGRGFVDAEWSQTGNEVVTGLGEIGSVDVKLEPDTIEKRLSDKFEEVDEGDGRRVYEGEFKDRRFVQDSPFDFDELNYNVHIGHEINGNNIIWVSNFPEDDNPWGPLFNDLEDAYGILEGTVGGKIGESKEYESMLDSDDQILNKAIQALERSFPDEFHELKANLMLNPNHSYPDKDFMSIGDFYMSQWDGDILEYSAGPITKEGDEFGVYVDRTFGPEEAELEDRNPNYVNEYG